MGLTEAKVSINKFRKKREAKYLKQQSTLIKNSQRKIYVFWRSMASTEYLVGEIIEDKVGENKTFHFRYSTEIKEAMDNGFNLILPFENTCMTYINNTLFGVFSSRLPDKRRKDMDNILKKYNLSQYDEIDLLVKTSGKLPIDNLYFKKHSGV